MVDGQYLGDNKSVCQIPLGPAYGFLQIERH